MSSGVCIYLTTKTHYSFHLLTFCLVVMEATEAGSEGLVRTVNENPSHSPVCVFSPLLPILLFSLFSPASISLSTFRQFDCVQFVSWHRLEHFSIFNTYLFSSSFISSLLLLLCLTAVINVRGFGEFPSPTGVAGACSQATDGSGHYYNYYKNV